MRQGCVALGIFGKFTSKAIKSWSFVVGRVLIMDLIFKIDTRLFRFSISSCVNFCFPRNLSISFDFSDEMINYYLIIDTKMFIIGSLSF